ncbi:MAG: type III-B CRISPR module RAMP protein Cmr1 [Nitrosomonas sp.]|nr:MAG: type III-B CRISPR module RAMP protein Cmr1 [Nitrosomonas sp.]
MRIRQPDISPPETVPDFSSSKRSKIYKVVTITPISGGGVETGVPDRDLPIRATAIRGQLRYWWRFLVSHRKENPVKDHKKLLEQERALWGGIGDKNRGFASKLIVRVRNVPTTRTEPCYKYTPNGTKDNGKPKYKEDFLHNIPPYALFSGKGKKPCDRSTPPKPEEIPVEVILNGLKFTFEVSSLGDKLTDTEWNTVLEAVRWWANFGGIGARTRRGLGSVAIEGIEPLTDQDVEVFGCKLKKLGETSDAVEAWNRCITKLQSFRQGKDIGRRSGSGKKLGRSYWPEADSIRLITGKNANGKHHPINTSGTFPRAAFGLPIIFDFNVPPPVGEPPKTELSSASENYERMASPLFLKAQYIGEKRFLPIALCLPAKHLRTLKVQLKCVESSHSDLPKTLACENQDVWWPKDEDRQKDLVADIKPLRNRGNDALSAFMHYFSENNS